MRDVSSEGLSSAVGRGLHALGLASISGAKRSDRVWLRLIRRPTTSAGPSCRTAFHTTGTRSCPYHPHHVSPKLPALPPTPPACNPVHLSRPDRDEEQGGMGVEMRLVWKSDQVVSTGWEKGVGQGSPRAWNTEVGTQGMGPSCDQGVGATWARRMSALTSSETPPGGVCRAASTRIPFTTGVPYLFTSTPCSPPAHAVICSPSHAGGL